MSSDANTDYRAVLQLSRIRNRTAKRQLKTFKSDTPIKVECKDVQDIRTEV